VTVSLWRKPTLRGGTGRAGKGERKTFVTRTNIYAIARDSAIPRSLDSIADDIHKLERSNLFDIGDLLLEAKAQCEHGEWGGWIWKNFEYAECTAQRYMQAATLAKKYRTVRDLKISTRTIYALAGEDEEHLPAIIEELTKSATKTRLTAADAQIIVARGRARGLYPDDDLSDAAASQIGLLNNSPTEKKIIADIRAQKPQTGQQTAAIVQTICRKVEEDRVAKQKEALAICGEAEKEAVALLDGPPPALPPSIVSPEPQTLGVSDDDDLSTEALNFMQVAMKLHALLGEPLSKFADVCTPKQLQEAIDFLSAVLVRAKLTRGDLDGGAVHGNATVTFEVDTKQ
jgi:hypothetical protein